MAVVIEVSKWLQQNRREAEAAHLSSLKDTGDGGISLQVAGKSLQLIIPTSSGESFMAFSDDFDSSDAPAFQDKVQRLNERLDGIRVNDFQDALSKIPCVLSALAKLFSAKQSKRKNQSLETAPVSSPFLRGTTTSASASKSSTFSSSGQQKQMLSVMKAYNSLSKAIAEAGNDDFLHGIAVEIPKEEDISIWHLKMHMDLFKSSKLLYKDLQMYSSSSLKNSSSDAEAKGRDHILLEFKFSEGYPFEPPFVRVVRPKFKFHTGHVTIGGSICMEALTKSGWSPAFSLESVVVQIHNAILEGEGRLDLISSSSDYSFEEALTAFTRVAREHRWNP